VHNLRQPLQLLKLWVSVLRKLRSWLLVCVLVINQYISGPKKENTKAKAKATPKSAAAANKASAGAKDAAGTAGKGRGKRGGRAGRPKPKSVEELDAEMSEYFVPNAAGGEAAPTTNDAAPAATNGGDAAMVVDEVL